MHSLSKTYNMTGWADRDGLRERRILSQGLAGSRPTSSGAFDAIQHAAIAALTGPQDCVANACAIYQERRDALVKEAYRGSGLTSRRRRRPSTSGRRSTTAWRLLQNSSTRPGSSRPPE